MPRILVTGATGVVGRELVKQLRTLGHHVRAATRHPVLSTFPEGTEVAEFDLERPETFSRALETVDRVFVISRPGDDHPERVAIPWIEAMARHGVRHVADLSAMGVEQAEDFGLRKVERHLEDAGIGFTHLRPNWFMQVFTSGPLCREIQTRGVLALPASDARISYVDARDIARAAACVLTQPGHVGHAYTLTGPEALDHSTIAKIISEAAGRQVTYVALDEPQARDAIVASGLSAQRAERLIGFYRLVRQGFCERVSCDVELITGRPGTPFCRFASDLGATWCVEPPSASA